MSIAVHPPPLLTPPARKRRRKRWIALALAVIALGAAFSLVAYFYSTDERDLAEVLAETDRLDPEWRWQNIVSRRAEIADADNASLQVIKAHRISGKVYDKFRKHFPPDGDPNLQGLAAAAPLPADQIAALRGLMADCPEARIEARKLRQLPKGRMPTKYTADVISTLIEPAQLAREVCAFLQCDAALRTHDHDFDGAVESCHAMLNAARSVGDEPFLICLLVRTACIQLMVDALERTLPQGEAREETLAQLQKALEQEMDEPTLLVALRGERGGHYELLELIRAGKVRPSYIAAMTGQRQNAYTRFMQDFLPVRASINRPAYLRMMNEMVEAAKLPLEKQPAEFERIQTAWKDKVTDLVGGPPFMDVTPAAFFRAQAVMRCTVAALAAERYRLRRGAWPGSLDVLVQEGLLAKVPLDPFDGQPLRYKSSDEGRVIYSVGPDRTDNGGIINRREVSAPGVDFGFRLRDARNGIR